MHNFIEYFSDIVPLRVVAILMLGFGIMQGIGEILEFKGKIVPEFMKVRKFVRRKRDEKDTMRKIPETLQKVETLLNNVDQHYSADNITKRDKWMDWVNSQATVYDTSIAELKSALDENNKITLSILIDSKRNYLLDFTSKAVDLNYPLSREQYQRFYNVHEEYEEILEKNNMTNGQVNVAYDVVTRSFEERLKKHAFIEDREYGS